MIHHNIQAKIIEYLAGHPGSSYADMRPAGVESNAFSYHLKLLMKEGLVKKRDDGKYRLTAIGGMISHNPKKSITERVKRAYSVMFLMARNDKGQWLVRRRMYPPLFGYVEAVLSHPVDEITVTEQAAVTFKERTGMQGAFRVAGTCFVRVVAGDELLSYKNITVLVADELNGELSKEAISEQCSWMSIEDLNKEEKLAPQMHDVIRLVEQGDLFWEELRYEIDPID
ncbi:MAG: helix-turn-helix domain-containing protein [Patescibacteria group bacterium]